MLAKTITLYLRLEAQMGYGGDEELERAMNKLKMESLDIVYNEDLWLTQAQIGKLFNKSKATILEVSRS